MVPNCHKKFYWNGPFFQSKSNARRSFSLTPLRHTHNTGIRRYLPVQPWQTRPSRRSGCVWHRPRVAHWRTLATRDGAGRRVAPLRCPPWPPPGANPGCPLPATDRQQAAHSTSAHVPEHRGGGLRVRYFKLPLSLCTMCTLATLLTLMHYDTAAVTWGRDFSRSVKYQHFILLFTHCEIFNGRWKRPSKINVGRIGFLTLMVAKRGIAATCNTRPGQMNLWQTRLPSCCDRMMADSNRSSYAISILGHFPACGPHPWGCQSAVHHPVLGHFRRLCSKKTQGSNIEDLYLSPTKRCIHVPKRENYTSCWTKYSH